MSEITLNRTCTELAIELKTAKQDGDIGKQNELLVQLEPDIHNIARFHARKLSATQAADFVIESPCFVWDRIELYQPELSQFRTWCSTVLCRKMIDVLRKNIRSVPRDSGADPNMSPSFQFDITFWSEIFSAAQLAFISRWDLQDRVETLAISALYPKVPIELWSSWIGEYEDKYHIRFTRPFPNTRLLTEIGRVSLFCSEERTINAIRMNFPRKLKTLVSKLPSLEDSLVESR